MRIGLDFDNTLADYDAVFVEAACGDGMVPPGFTGAKADVRRAVRALDDGQFLWERLQGRVYGALMPRARLFEGVDDFLRACRKAGATVYIISHKTRHGHHDPDRVDLRRAALAWMADKGFFDADAHAIPRGNVFFEGTRAEKLGCIAGLGLDLFVDDLVELFNDDGFPEGVGRMLFHPIPESVPKGPFEVFGSWREIERACFGRPE